MVERSRRVSEGVVLCFKNSGRLSCVEEEYVSITLKWMDLSQESC